VLREAVDLPLSDEPLDEADYYQDPETEDPDEHPRGERVLAVLLAQAAPRMARKDSGSRSPRKGRVGPRVGDVTTDLNVGAVDGGRGDHRPAFCGAMPELASGTQQEWNRPASVCRRTRRPQAPWLSDSRPKALRRRSAVRTRLGASGPTDFLPIPGGWLVHPLQRHRSSEHSRASRPCVAGLLARWERAQ
jgi:hypothetical protein